MNTINKLIKKRNRLKERYDKEYRKNVERFANIPFGYGMRAYSRLRCNYSKEDELRDKLKEIEQQIKTL